MAKLKYNAKVYEDTAANLATDATVFKANDLIFASDTGELKRGNGVDAYADLSPIGGGGEAGAVAWGDITGKPVVIASGADAAAARASIGAGTGNGNSNLALGTTATTAKAGDYTPAWGDVSGKPATFPPASHAATLVTVAADATNGIAAGTAQVVLSALAARIKALEDAV